MAEIKYSGISKAFGKVEVLRDINIDIADGEFAVFVGPSGCGKTTLLRVTAGLEGIGAGELFIDGERVNDLTPPERGIAMVFQSYALYPHMSAYKNMSFGLKMSKIGRQEADRRVRKAAATLQIEHLLDRRPAQLSGGQRQRVAIGRAIVRDPKVFLFDEPLSNLDAALRVQTRLEIAKLHQELGSTVIYVTHDQVEAMTLADNIVVLNEGKVAQAGTPLALYHHPRNLFVAGFIGSPTMNFISARISAVEDRRMTVELEGGETISVHVLAGSARVGDTVTLGVRPEHLHEGAGAQIRLDGAVEVVERLGDVSYIHVRLGDGNGLVASSPGSSRIHHGQAVTVSTDAAAVHVFDEAGTAFEQLSEDPRYRIDEALLRASGADL